MKTISIRIKKEIKDELKAMSEAFGQSLTDFVIEHALSCPVAGKILYVEEPGLDGMLPLVVQDSVFMSLEQKAASLGFHKVSIFIKYVILRTNEDSMKHAVVVRLTKTQKNYLDAQVEFLRIGSPSMYIKLLGLTIYDKPSGLVEPDFGEAKTEAVKFYLDSRDMEVFISKSREFGFERVSTFIRHLIENCQIASRNKQ